MKSVKWVASSAPPPFHAPPFPHVKPMALFAFYTVKCRSAVFSPSLPFLFPFFLKVFFSFFFFHGRPAGAEPEAGGTPVPFKPALLFSFPFPPLLVSLQRHSDSGGREGDRSFSPSSLGRFRPLFLSRRTATGQLGVRASRKHPSLWGLPTFLPPSFSDKSLFLFRVRRRRLRNK